MGKGEYERVERVRGEGKRDIRQPFIPPPWAAMEDMNIILPQRWAFIPSTTPLTRMKEARRLMLRVCSNSERGMSLFGGDGGVSIWGGGGGGGRKVGMRETRGGGKSTRYLLFAFRSRRC